MLYKIGECVRVNPHNVLQGIIGLCNWYLQSTHTFWLMECCTTWKIFTSQFVPLYQRVTDSTSGMSSESVKVFGFRVSNGSSDGDGLAQMSSMMHQKVSPRKKRRLYPYNGIPELKDPHQLPYLQSWSWDPGSIQKKMVTYPEGQKKNFHVACCFCRKKRSPLKWGQQDCVDELLLTRHDTSFSE